MKKFTLPALVGAAVLASAMIGLSGQAVAGISDTKHNLSTSGTGDIRSDNPEICVFCHTPHNAIKNNNIPLWNHELSATANYGVYTSPSFDGSVSITDVGGATEGTATVTNLCLSCHDGTVALNSMNNPSNAHLVTTMSGSGLGTGDVIENSRATNLGADLTNDHPVNFTYNAALVTADPTLNDPSTLTDVRLFNDTVQCASCHDPHASDPTTQPFLRFTMTGSALCLKCHNK